MNLEFLTLIPDIRYERVYLSYIAGGLVSFVATAYAIQIYKERLHVNIATWGMILLVDILGFVFAISAGNPHPYIHIAWVTTDALICLAALKYKTSWRWSYIESISLVLFICSLLLWRTSEAIWSVLGYLVACFFTLLPQGVQYWKNKHIARKSAWIWIINSIAIVMTMLSLSNITLEYSIATLGLLILNLTMVLIAVR